MAQEDFKITELPTAIEFIKRIEAVATSEQAKQHLRYFKTGEGQYGAGDKFIGVRMGQVFTLAKEFIQMEPAEIARLLQHQIHEVRAGGLSIMDKQARSKRTTPERRKELYDLYISALKDGKINNWDLVDVSTIYVVGGYLFDKSKDVLYKLARSKDLWERRTAIVSTAYFIRQNDLEDVFALAEILVDDKEDLIHKATGWMLRFAGDKDRKQLIKFLDKYAATMPRTLLRYSLEHFDKPEREYYMKLKK